MTEASISTRSWTLLAALSLLWGASFLVTSVLVDQLAPLHVVTHRVLWAAAFLWAYVGLRRLPLPRDLPTIGALLVVGLLNNVAPFTLQAYAQTTIESGLAGILNATAALFGPLVAALVFADERLTRNKALGVALGFAGVVAVIGLDVLGGFDPRALAQLAMLGSTLCYALAGAWARARLRHLRPEVAALGMLTASSLTLLPLSWALAGPLPFALPPATLGALALYGLAITALAYLIYYALIARVGAGNTMLVTLLIVPVAVGLGALLRSETLPPSAYAGFALIALGLVVIDGRLPARLFARGAGR